MFLVPTEGPPESLPSDVDSWVEDNGGIPAYGQFIRLEIRSQNETPVVITGIDAHVISRKTPATGWFVLQEDPSCGGGELETAPVEIDISRRSRPDIKYTGWPRDKMGGPKPLTATEKSPQFIDIYAYPGGYLVEWELFVDYSLGDTTDHQYRVGSTSEPLRVTGLLPGRADAYQPNNVYQYDEPFKSLEPAETPNLGDPPLVSC